MFANIFEDARYVKNVKIPRTMELGEPNSFEVPQRRWGSIATDFIVKIPKTKNVYNSITTVVSKLTRGVRFTPSKDTDTAVDVANSFFNNIVKLNGLPDSIVPYRDSKFMSIFWGQLMKLCEIRLKMSTSRHAQTGGASEIMNRMKENCLRCLCISKQDNWDELLPTAEFAYSSAFNDELCMDPFEMDLGWIPRFPLDMVVGKQSDVQGVEDFKENLKVSLKDAQFASKVSRARQAAAISSRAQPPSYQIGEKF